RGTQLSETVSYLLENGAKEIHVRSACPPIMYGCKYLNFSRSVSDMELITRRCIVELEGLAESEKASANPNGSDKMEEIKLDAELLAEYADQHSERHKKMVELIEKKLDFDSLRFQELDSLVEAIGVDRCKLCTYCWDGKE
ncbi:MAG: hypothetical protein UHP11_04950, partial [Anaerovoracaceae bacterium]|nr:hypothetical protein [Anaerovoracaceae bacterium]